MHQIRQAVRGNGTILMGKNTMVRRAIRLILADHPDFERFLPLVKGNVGFVFTSADLKDIREIIVSNKVAAPAKANAFAPNDIYVPAGNTGMEPGKTSFFQALNIPTKIARGTIEITSDVHLVQAGNKVDASQATLLNMLGISPFTYGMKIISIFSDGQLFPESVLDVDESELVERFLSGVKAIAAISLALNYPTLASVTHSLVNSYKNLLAIALETDVTFEAAEALKERLANPEAFAAAAPAAAAESSSAAPAADEKKEDEEESDDDMGCVTLSLSNELSPRASYALTMSPSPSLPRPSSSRRRRLHSRLRPLPRPKPRRRPQLAPLPHQPDVAWPACFDSSSSLSRLANSASPALALDSTGSLEQLRALRLSIVRP